MVFTPQPANPLKRLTYSYSPLRRISSLTATSKPVDCCIKFPYAIVNQQFRWYTCIILILLDISRQPVRHHVDMSRRLDFLTFLCLMFIKPEQGPRLNATTLLSPFREGVIHCQPQPQKDHPPSDAPPCIRKVAAHIARPSLPRSSPHSPAGPGYHSALS